MEDLGPQEPDETLPDAQLISAAEPAIQAFKDATVLVLVAPRTGAKRKAVELNGEVRCQCVSVRSAGQCASAYHGL